MNIIGGKVEMKDLVGRGRFGRQRALPGRALGALICGDPGNQPLSRATKAIVLAEAGIDGRLVQVSNRRAQAELRRTFCTDHRSPVGVLRREHSRPPGPARRSPGRSGGGAGVRFRRSCTGAGRPGVREGMARISPGAR
jgi:hypothetical protein